MGACCSGDATCVLPQAEIASIHGIVAEHVRNSAVPVALPFVGKGLATRGTHPNKIFDNLKMDLADIKSYQVDGEHCPDLSLSGINDNIISMSKLVQKVIFQSSAECNRLLMPAVMRSVKGGADETAKKRCGERCVNQTCQSACFSEMRKMYNRHDDQIRKFYKKQENSSSPPSPNVPHSPSNQQIRTVTGLDPNQISNQPEHQNSPHSPHHSPTTFNNDQQGGNSYAVADNNANQQQQDLQQQESWLRYPLPEENGPWVQFDEQFFWSEEAQLYYFPAGGHFFHPESEMWNDPLTDRWMTEEEHEQLLDQMADQGLY